MARHYEAHEIMRQWRMTYETDRMYGLNLVVESPDIGSAIGYFRARYPYYLYKHAAEITTPAQLAAELERVQPFLAVREAVQAELESKARTAAFVAKTTLYRVLAGATTVGVVILGVLAAVL